MDATITLVDQVCRQLSTRRGRSLADGDGWLPSERQLAEQLEVSRTVVREATKRLELQGLLEVQHGVGIRFVDRLHLPFSAAVTLSLPDDAARLAQLVEARSVIEPELARLAAQRATKPQLRELRQNQERFAAVVDTVAAIDLDLEFHRLIARAAANRIFELMLESLGQLGRASRQATLAFTGVGRAVEHHQEILRAIEGGRPLEARDAMGRHVQGSASDLNVYFTDRRGTSS